MIKRVFSIDEQRAILDLCWRFETAWQQGDCQSATEWLNTNYTGHAATVDSATALAELEIVESELRDKCENCTTEVKVGHGRTWDDVLTTENLTPPVNERYKFLREIARGGAGVVWHVYDVQLHRFSAIKLLLDSQDNSEMRYRLAREARISGSLQHPGIVPIYELSVLDDGRPFINMKLIDGKTLDAILAETESRSQKDLLRIFRHVCDAIAYAHSQEVIHRDLKPNNIMVGAFGEVQIMDWGLAKMLRSQHTDAWLDMIQVGKVGDELPAMPQTPSTCIGSVFGTPAYMSPEQARGELESVEKRSDVFALGGILCKILTGSPVYLESNMVELRDLARNGNTAPAIVRVRKSHASRAIKSLAISCIESDPKCRPTDAGDVLRCLDRIAIMEQVRKKILFAFLALAIGFGCFFLFELIGYLTIKAIILDADGAVIQR